MYVRVHIHLNATRKAISKLNASGNSYIYGINNKSPAYGPKERIRGVFNPNTEVSLQGYAHAFCSGKRIHIFVGIK